MSEFTREQIIEAAKHCLKKNGGDCEGCPLIGQNCGKIRDLFIASLPKENEPAPSANDTSSKENIVYKDDSTALKICQELISQARADLLTMYDGMSEGECRAWELGELYKTLELALKAGEQHNKENN